VTLTGTGVSPAQALPRWPLLLRGGGTFLWGASVLYGNHGSDQRYRNSNRVVSFVLDGTQVALISAVKGVATLELNSGLTGGLHSIYADYKGDTADNASSSVVMPVTIAKAPTTPILTVTKIPYNNPYSLRHSNAGSCSVWTPKATPPHSRLSRTIHRLHSVGYLCGSRRAERNLDLLQRRPSDQRGPAPAPNLSSWQVEGPSRITRPSMSC